MLDKFWGAVGEKLGGQWITALLQPALAFWAVGLLAWVHHQTNGWQALLDWWNRLGSTEAQLAVLVGMLLGILTSSVVMGWAQVWLLRFLEGYWPRWLNFVSRPLRTRVCKKLTPKMARWQTLAQEVADHGGDLYNLSNAEREEFARLDHDILLLYPPTHTPPQPGDVLPTALGNRLKAAELHAGARYGLQDITPVRPRLLWPRLWPLLPDVLRNDLIEARANLNAAVRLVGWGVLTCGWSLWAWWALPLGIIVVILAWYRALDVADVYGDLLRTAFDLHRFDLYKALHWPLPRKTGEAECADGKQLTQYLFRGLTQYPVRLVHTAESGEKG